MESIDKVKLAVLNQIQGTSGLYSLKLQNHIYGCFIIMEDIAQQVVNTSGTSLNGDKFSFDFDKQFAEIGLRYGFAMDTKLLFDTFTPEYKDAWIQQFNYINKTHDINIADNLEDSIIEIIQKNIQAEDAFFINALNTGSLPQDWIEKALNLLNSTLLNSEQNCGTNCGLNVTPEKNIINDNNIEDEKLINTAISHAITEKPLHKQRRLDVTRRNKRTYRQPIPSTQKKSLAKTRRNYNK